MRVTIGLAALLTGAAAGAVAAGGQASAADRSAIERVVHDYILAHPEILPEAMDRLQQREIAKAVRANRAVIEKPFANAWEGAADADVTLVEFFDYACGYCRASLPDIDRLLREDKHIKIVYREFPVLGPDSEEAARISLAAAKGTRYAAFHRALYASGRPDTRARSNVAHQFGLNPNESLTPDAAQEIAANRDLQRALNLTGTPSWVVGDRVLSGAVGYDGLKAAIAEARSKRGQS
ncbi:MAG: DsbA family protein [Sphingomonadaceae bacterium]|nr:DsbA family protein [Sphingomonadaceae bacterium]